MLLEDVTDPGAVSETAGRVQQILAAPYQIQGRKIYLTAGVEIAMSGGEVRSAATMIQYADTAMYHAKLNGKANVALFDPKMHDKALQRLQLETDLYGAVERGELRVYYQPIVALKNLQMVGVESLVRWQHPQCGLLLPGEFLPIAEEAGRMAAISWWVLKESCRQPQQWRSDQAEASQLWMSVNIGWHTARTQPVHLRRSASWVSSCASMTSALATRR